MQTATSRTIPIPLRQRGDRVRGHIIRAFAMLPLKNRPMAGHVHLIIERSVRRVDDAHNDSQPLIQWLAQETAYARPPKAMQALAKGIARAIGCIWFEEREGQPSSDRRRWYHYGGSSKLRVWVAMFLFEKSWDACDAFAHYELLKLGTEHTGERRTFVSEQREAWVERLCALLPEREIESWVVQEWRLAKSKARARGHKHNRQPPRSMSYEDVARWLDGVIESWQV